MRASTSLLIQETGASPIETSPLQAGGPRVLAHQVGKRLFGLGGPHRARPNNPPSNGSSTWAFTGDQVGLPPPPETMSGGSEPAAQELLWEGEDAGSVSIDPEAWATDTADKRHVRAASAAAPRASEAPRSKLPALATAVAALLMTTAPADEMEAAAFAAVSQPSLSGPDAEPSTLCRVGGTETSPETPAPAAPSTTQTVITSPHTPAAMSRPLWNVGDYNVTRRLFKGSVSSVYKASCLHSGMPVVLKCYFAAKVPHNVVLRREVELHAALHHKHIVQLYGAFADAERLVLVQEYAARGDLYQVLKKMGGRMPEQQVARAVMAPFLSALHYMHAKGVCHRDIKPENLLVDASGRVLLADFGIAINLHQERAVTRAGTTGYMAPEVERCPLKMYAHENKDVPSLAYSTAADIWAAGVLAYELLVGFTPVVAPDSASAAGGAPVAEALAAGGAAEAAARQQQQQLSEFVAQEMTSSTLHFPSSVSAAARDFIMSALQADPADRPTAKQLLRHSWVTGA